MNVRCDPDQGGCGTLFTVGATMCPNCQLPAEEVAVLNPEGLQPRELDAEQPADEPPDFGPRMRTVELPPDDEKQETTDE